MYSLYIISYNERRDHPESSKGACILPKHILVMAENLYLKRGQIKH